MSPVDRLSSASLVLARMVDVPARARNGVLYGLLAGFSFERTSNEPPRRFPWGGRTGEYQPGTDAVIATAAALFEVLECGVDTSEDDGDDYDIGVQGQGEGLQVDEMVTPGAHADDAVGSSAKACAKRTVDALRRRHDAALRAAASVPAVVRCIRCLRTEVDARGITVAQLSRILAAVGSTDCFYGAMVTVRRVTAWSIHRGLSVSECDPRLASADAADIARFRESVQEPPQRPAVPDATAAVLAVTSRPRFGHPLRSPTFTSQWPQLYEALTALQADWTVAAAHLALVVPISSHGAWTAASRGAVWPRRDVERLLQAAWQQGVTAAELYEALADEHPMLAHLVVWHLQRHTLAYHPPDVLSASYASWPTAPLLPSPDLGDTSDPRDDGPGGGGSKTRSNNGNGLFEQLPAELLTAILLHLPLEALVRCRQVSHRWRAAIADIAARDRKYLFQCGAAAFATLRQVDGCRSLGRFDGGLSIEHQASMLGLWCTCGRPLATAEAFTLFDIASNARLTLTMPPLPPGAVLEAARALRYSQQHFARLPPARWQQLRPSHVLACELTSAWATVNSGFVCQFDPSSMPWPWIPLFLWLPDPVVRPTTSKELLGLVKHLITRVGTDPGALASLFETLSSSTAGARAWYAQASEAVENRYRRSRSSGPTNLERPTWWDAWREPVHVDRETVAMVRAIINDHDEPPESVDAVIEDYVRKSTPFGQSNAGIVVTAAMDVWSWEHRQYRAREAVVIWKTYVACDAEGEFVHRLAHVAHADLQMRRTRSTAALTADMERLVDDLDAAVALMRARCPLSVCYVSTPPPVTRAGPLYAVGLSHQCHLIGSVTLDAWRDDD